MKSQSTPIVSVVIPMYNVEKYLRQCLDSVLAQTFRQFEVICVDDGCQDGTLSILEEYDDPRIFLIQQRNRGLSGARNTGIKAARGIYVALLDSDDFWAPEKLAKHVNHLNHNPDVGVSYCPSWFVDDDGKPMGIGQFPKLKHISKKTVICRNPVGNGSAAVIRRSLLMDMDMNKGTGKRFMAFDEALRQSEDIELWTRIALSKNCKFEGIASPMTFYRVNGGGLSANLAKQLATWEYAMDKNRRSYPKAFAQVYGLAKAYQLRYLARRAVQSRQSWTAIRLVHQALFCNLGILREEPKRTLLTLGCAWLSLLPKPLYQAIEQFAMGQVGQQLQQKTQWQQELKPKL